VSANAPTFLLLAFAMLTCTRSDDGVTPTSPATEATATCPTFVLDRHDGACVDTFGFDARTYRVACVEVPSVLLDVAVDARWGRRPVHAIVAVPSVQGLAVVADDEDGCGAFALAVASDVSAETQAAIVDEVERAAALPADLERPDPADAEG
jgi:hypothetical protein